MRAGSLCTGYGGLDLAVEEVLGAELVWLSEIDKHASRLCEKRFAGVPNLGDLKTIDWASVPPVDVLSAGYPCQPFSSAGKRAGTDDPRHLWPFIRDAIGVLRPRLVVLENVRGHLTLGFEQVLADLHALGFDAEWSLVRASDVGACHQRARLFIVAADARGERHGRGQDAGLVGGEDRRVESELGERQRSREVAGDRSTEDASDPQDIRRERLGDAREWGTGSADGREAPADADSQRPQGRRADAQREGEQPPRSGGVEVPADACGDRLVPDTEPDGPSIPWGEEGGGRDDADGLADVDWAEYGPAIRRHEQVIGRCAPFPSDGEGRLSPCFVEWMMMLPEGWVTDFDFSRTQQLKMLGNGVVPPQAVHALTGLLGRL